MDEEYLECDVVLFADGVPIMALVAYGQHCYGCGAPINSLKCEYCDRQYKPKV